MPYSVKGFLDISEDMVQILLMLEVPFTQDCEVGDLFCGLLPALNQACYSAITSSSKPIRDDFQYDFARVTDEVDSSVVLAEL